MSVDRCNKAALRYVSAAVKTEGQVREYLFGKEFSEKDIEASIEMLKSYNYIDDAEYCKAYYKQACRKGRGRRRIEQELERKKIAKEMIKDTLDFYLSHENPDYEEVVEETLTEKDRAMTVVTKMVKEQREKGKALDKNFYAKVGRRLTANGYSADIIYYAIGRVMKESNDE